jgi:hypothetical protein
VFLLWASIIEVPQRCKDGHDWNFSEQERFIGMHCLKTVGRFVAEEGDERRDCRKRCNKKFRWNSNGFPAALPHSMRPEQLMKAI